MIAIDACALNFLLLFSPTGILYQVRPSLLGSMLLYSSSDALYPIDAHPPSPPRSLLLFSLISTLCQLSAVVHVLWYLASSDCFICCSHLLFFMLLPGFLASYCQPLYLYYTIRALLYAIWQLLDNWHICGMQKSKNGMGG